MVYLHLSQLLTKNFWFFHYTTFHSKGEPESAEWGTNIELAH